MLVLVAEEEIVSFHSRIDVQTNATLTVLETIRVRSEQRLIQLEDHPQVGTKITDFVRILELVDDNRLKVNLGQRIRSA